MSSKKKPNKTDQVLIACVNPKNLDLSLGVLYQFGFTTIEQKRLKNKFQLTFSLDGRKSLLKRIRNFKSWDRKEKIFENVKIKKIPRKRWSENYKKYLRPFRFIAFGKKSRESLWIDPRGKKISKPRPDTLYLEPGLAFGTGTHPTTQLSAELLGEILNGNMKSSLLDLGCGSGLLAMTAFKQGATSIYAIDNDPVALQVAQENFKQNEIKGITTKNSLKRINRKFDGIVANILLSTLIELKNQIIAHLKPNGFLILSGLTYKDRKELLQTYREFRFIKQKNRKGWSAFLFKFSPLPEKS